MKKTWIAVLLALCMVFTLLPFGSAAANFTDLEPGAYYLEAVDWALKHNPVITKGTTDSTFSPNQTCTRDQVVTFLWRAFGAEKMFITNPFVDVLTTDYFYNSAVWASREKITTGTDATHFSPTLPCTREQVATFLWRAKGSPAPKTSASPFADVKDPTHYSYKPILWAYENGVTNGTDATHFSPEQPCTRAQIVTFLYRALVKPMDPVQPTVEPTIQPTVEPTTQPTTQPAADQISLLKSDIMKKPDGTMTGYVFTYDENGNNTRVTSLDGSKWENHIFDAKGNMIIRYDDEGSRFIYEYDENGNRIGDGDGEMPTDEVKDSLGRVVRQIIHYGTYDEILNFEYEGNSDRIRAITDGEGHLLTLYSYDAQGREILAETFNGNGTPLRKHFHEYDDQGNVTKEREETYTDGKMEWNQTVYTWDKDEVLADETFTSSSGDNVKTVYVYTFDANGYLVKKVATIHKPDGVYVNTLEYMTFDTSKLLRFGGRCYYPLNF